MSSTSVDASTPSVSSPERLASWMDAAGLAPGAPLTINYISGGSQNEIYEIVRGDAWRAVLRIPPTTAYPERDDGILREYQVISALDGTDVPHTPAIGVCEDKSVLGRTFYLMGFVDGWSPMQTRRTWPEPFHSDVSARRGLSFQLIEGIALLSRVDWRSRGLEGLGRPDGFHERQVDRWTAFLSRFKGRDLPGWDEAGAWLRSHRPLDYIPGIMHGDYQFANVMFEHGGPARLAAMVDWEMGTVGDPKLDLAWVIQSWPEDTSGGDGSVGGYVDLTGMPSRAELLAHYASVSGRQVDDIDYYNILARWKLGTVLEQTYQRSGDSGKAASFGAIAESLTRGAAELAASTDYDHKG